MLKRIDKFLKKYQRYITPEEKPGDLVVMKNWYGKIMGSYEVPEVPQYYKNKLKRKRK